MRQVALVRRSTDKTRRVMLYDDGEQCYLFYFDTLLDGPCFADTWHPTIAEAKRVCAEHFGIREDDWQMVPDPQGGCQHDIIAPIN